MSRAGAAVAAVLAALLLLAGQPAAVAANGADGADWQLAGTMGMLQFIVVPEARARDRDYYRRVIHEACGENTTCFVRFFTNSRNLPLSMPLADEIYAEQTASFSRSMKALKEDFSFACRLGMPDDGCF